MTEGAVEPTGSPRILSVTPLPPEILGGIEEYVYQVSTFLEGLGYRVRIVTSRFPRRGELALRERPYSHAAITSELRANLVLRRPLIVDPVGIIRLAQLVRDSDVVHVFMPFPFLESVVALYAKVFHKPLVSTYICDAVIRPEGPRTGSTSLIESLYDCLSSIPTLRAATAICSSSRSFVGQSRVLRRFGGRVTVIHQGVAIDELSNFSNGDVIRMRRRLLGEDYDILITSVGRLVPYKGVRYLIHAFKLLTDELNERCLLVIGGSGPERAELQNEANRLRLHGHVKFLGYVKDKDLPALFSASDVFVAPSVSTSESTAITLLQALALGVPVVGTSVGGTEESVPNDGIHGLIVPERDVGKLKDAIVTLLEVAKRGQSGKDQFRRSWRDVAVDYSILYKQILRES